MERETQEIIEECARAAHHGSMNFPAIVGRLLAAGISHYRVDFLRSESTYYDRDGQSHIVVNDMPNEPVAVHFEPTAMAAAVRASQQDGQTYPAFVLRSLRAGCIGYTAYLDGQRVVYYGWLGDTHVEYFPGSNFDPSLKD